MLFSPTNEGRGAPECRPCRKKKRVFRFLSGCSRARAFERAVVRRGNGSTRILRIVAELPRETCSRSVSPRDLVAALVGRNAGDGAPALVRRAGIREDPQGLR